MLTPVALIKKAKRDQPFEIFRQAVLAGYALVRGDEEGAKYHAIRAKTLAALDWGEGPKNIDAVMEKFLENSVLKRPGVACTCGAIEE